MDDLSLCEEQLKKTKQQLAASMAESRDFGELTESLKVKLEQCEDDLEQFRREGHLRNDEVSALKVHLSERETELASRDNVLTSLRLSIVEKDDEITSIRSMIKLQEREGFSIRLELEHKDRELVSLQTRLQEQLDGGAESHRLLSDLELLRSEKASLVVKIEEKERDLNDRRLQIERLEEALRSMGDDLKLKQVEVQSLERQLEHESKALTSTEHRLQEMDKELNLLRSKLSQADANQERSKLERCEALEKLRKEVEQEEGQRCSFEVESLTLKHTSSMSELEESLRRDAESELEALKLRHDRELEETLKALQMHHSQELKEALDELNSQHTQDIAELRKALDAATKPSYVEQHPLNSDVEELTSRVRTAEMYVEQLVSNHEEELVRIEGHHALAVKEALQKADDEHKRALAKLREQLQQEWRRRLDEEKEQHAEETARLHDDLETARQRVETCLAPSKDFVDTLETRVSEHEVTAAGEHELETEMDAETFKQLQVGRFLIFVKRHSVYLTFDDPSRLFESLFI